MGISQHEQAKKPAKQGKAHNARPVELPPGVDWEEQERLAKSLKNAFIPPDPNVKNCSYTPELAAALCAHRRVGKSARMISRETGISTATIRHWQEDYPEFSQAWNDMYHDYLQDNAEELVPRVEKLMEGLRLDGKRLSVVQEKRYLKRLEALSGEIRWAASRRVPELYGIDETGGELVLVQPMNIPERTVTQAPDIAEQHRQEVEDARKAYLPAPLGSDGEGSMATGEVDNPGPSDSDQPGGEGVSPKRRYKMRGSRVLKRSKWLSNEERTTEMDRSDGGNVDPGSAGQ